MSDRSFEEILAVYQGSNGERTTALYRELEQLGPIGVIAVNLFRACKTSERAKLYRPGRGYRTIAYERKDWSIGNLSRALHVQHAQQLHAIRWGWAVDLVLHDRGEPHHHILYVDLPTGQVSFHTSHRRDGPDYTGAWDGVRGEAGHRICRWVADLFAARPPPMAKEQAGDDA